MTIAAPRDPSSTIVPAERSRIERDDWETPPAIFRAYDEMHRFTIDVAASAANRMVPRYFDRETDGLNRSWLGERVWLHPPHADAARWAARALHFAKRGTLVVGLMPARTYESWWHESVAPYARLHFLVGPIMWRLHRLPITGLRELDRPRGGFAVVEWHPTRRQ